MITLLLLQSMINVKIVMIMKMIPFMYMISKLTNQLYPMLHKGPNIIVCLYWNSQLCLPGTEQQQSRILKRRVDTIPRQTTLEVWIFRKTPFRCKYFTQCHFYVFRSPNSKDWHIWIFSFNIVLNMLPSDSIMSWLHSLLGYSIGKFLALQLIALVMSGVVNYPLASCMLVHLLENLV